MSHLLMHIFYLEVTDKNKEEWEIYLGMGFILFSFVKKMKFTTKLETDTLNWLATKDYYYLLD